MDRNRPFTKYRHGADVRGEVPMHTHTNGQLNYVDEGAVRLLAPASTWVVPRLRLIWIPPQHPHSLRYEKRSSGWKVMIPRHYAKFLPKEVAILESSELLVAALKALPNGSLKISSSRLKAIIGVIQQELPICKQESFGLPLPTSGQLREIAEILMKKPEDPRQIDDWAREAGMARRTFTRSFARETGCSFGEWRKNLLLSRALELLAQGSSVSETADRLGYANPSAFIFAFRKKYGSSPLKFTK